jgi:hypothetical protein
MTFRTHHKDVYITQISERLNLCDISNVSHVR